MIHEENQTRKLFGADSSLGLFVSLYLLLLAFFVILNAMSNQATSRAEAVMDSVSATFRNPAVPMAENFDFLAEEELPGPTDTVLTDINGLFMTEFSIPGRYTSEGGDVMEFTIPESFFYVRGSLTVRTDKHPFLDSLIETIKRIDKGTQQEMVFMFASGTGRISSGLDAGQELSIRRAGALARMLADKGLPLGAFSTGFAPVETGTLTILVRSVPTSSGGR
ncbi:hypothetical protein GCM10017044_25730 [Kordiimonas sediminis]|uniref:OmpA-like domain-containing protein n=1 Tax=Kordiimonas sediminis TaxID=1735581 RepID=A0A919AX33_9PROT|nr:hypothetical protein [Kordiimonas sediminis]GHF29331.1 hypothetical protein GCM10017044_25730 [Kordiimonas sediminis]